MTVNENTPSPDWVKSSYSNGQAAECVEWAPEYARATGDFLVRDSKDPDGPYLRLTAEGWAGLVAFAKSHG